MEKREPQESENNLASRFAEKNLDISLEDHRSTETKSSEFKQNYLCARMLFGPSYDIPGL